MGNESIKQKNIYEEIEKGNIEEIRILLNLEDHLKLHDDLLFHASQCQNPKKEILNLLLSKNFSQFETSNPNYRKVDCLRLLCQNKSPSITTDLLETLISHKANPSKIYKEGKNLLHISILKNQNVEIIKFLTKFVDLEEKDDYFLTPLLIECSKPKPNEKIISHFLNNKAFPNTHDTFKRNPLHLIFQNSDFFSCEPELITLFIEKKIEINNTDNNHESCLHVNKKIF